MSETSTQDVELPASSAAPPPGATTGGAAVGDAEQPKTDSPVTSTRATSDGGAIFGLLFWAVMGGFWLFAAVDSWLIRSLVIGAASALVLGVIIWFWGKGQRRATWESFKRQMRLLTGLTITVLGAPAVAVLLANNDRMLALKLVVIVLLSFLPAALYWQFIAGKGRALWDEFVINLYRLGVDHPVSLPEPPVQSVFHALWEREHSGPEFEDKAERRNNLYQKKFEGVYGTLSDELSQRVVAENALPVVFATLFISLGWVLVLQPEAVFLRTFGVVVPAASTTVPLQEIGFAFLGAYFYSLQMLMRRYYQNDLKTSAYINVSMRIVIVVLLTWILSEVWKGDPQGSSAPWRYGIAFTIGVFPDVGWQLLQRLLKLPVGWIDDSFRIRYPLSEVDGLNPWYQSRLLEEGIEDMQTIVTANLVDVMLHTRIPIDRLVDWIDQSVLLLHLPKDPNTESDAKDTAPLGTREILSRLGIRKATELLSVYRPSEYTFRIPALQPKNGERDQSLEVIASVAEAVRHEPVLHQVVQWKNFAHEYLEAVGSKTARSVGRLQPPSGHIARQSLGVESIGDVLT